MRLVVDTNVFISGVFFSGPPHEILKAWRDGVVELVLSPEILEEYQAVGEELSNEFPGVELGPWLELAALAAIVAPSPSFQEPVCADPDDDKFLACALAAGTRLVTSGDKALLATSGFMGIKVLTPRQFVDSHLRTRRHQ